MSKETDIYEAELDAQIAIVKACQDGKGSTCMKCKEYIACPIRKTYVLAVYKSMNKGETGGFEFG